MRFRKALLILVTLASLGLAYFLKQPCLTSWGQVSRIEYSRACYNDLQPLYEMRGFDRHKIPYVEQREFEYPPVMASQLWLASYFSKTGAEFFKVNAAFLAVATLLTLFALIAAIGTRDRVLWLAAAPPLITYAFYNCDMLAVAFLAGAMWAWRRRWLAASGAFLGLGMATKLFPVFALPPLLIAAHAKPRGRDAVVRVLAGFAVAWLVVNVPFVVGDWLKNGNVNGWLEMFLFHARRYPDFGTIWYWLHPTTDSYRAIIDRVSLGLFLGGTLSLLFLQSKDGLKPWPVAGAIVALFLLVNKVHSPQYALWLLPFFVVTRAPTLLVLAYFAADALVFRTGMRWMLETPPMGPDGIRSLHGLSIFLRAFVLSLLIARYTSVRLRNA